MTSSPGPSSDEVRARREALLLRLLIRMSQVETNELVATLRGSGYEVTQAWVFLLANIDTEGTQLGTVAKRLGTTSQAVSQLVRAIEAAGFLARVPHPDDRRVVIVRHTPAGRELLTGAMDAMTSIEERYERVLGPRRMRELRRALTDLANATDPTGRLSPP